MGLSAALGLPPGEKTRDHTQRQIVNHLSKHKMCNKDPQRCGEKEKGKQDGRPMKGEVGRGFKRERKEKEGKRRATVRKKKLC